MRIEYNSTELYRAVYNIYIRYIMRNYVIPNVNRRRTIPNVLGIMNIVRRFIPYYNGINDETV